MDPLEYYVHKMEHDSRVEAASRHAGEILSRPRHEDEVSAAGKAEGFRARVSLSVANALIRRGRRLRVHYLGTAGGSRRRPEGRAFR